MRQISYAGGNFIIQNFYFIVFSSNVNYYFPEHFIEKRVPTSLALRPIERRDKERNRTTRNGRHLVRRRAQPYQPAVEKRGAVDRLPQKTAHGGQEGPAAPVGHDMSHHRHRGPLGLRVPFGG